MREQSLFIEALEKEDPAERATFLDRVCAEDAALRRRLERLLQRHAQTDGFLGTPALLGADATRDGPGAVVGQYKLLEQIGEGGFGVVYMAEQQEPVRRRVALKLIKPGMDTRLVIARFEAERQALALMDHPNIARILDADETPSAGGSPRPYFVMELVRGVPITEFCDRNNLPVPQRLELFVSVCQAVQHAHQKGIIHRDLKPSNVLVTLHDGVAVPKVIDFGIAKATGFRLTDRTLFTGFAQLIGTPLYMSPEQAEMSGLDVDTRSDIYSLGVLLYELLTGTTPFGEERLRRVGFDEVRRIIREEEPPRPSARISTLSRILDTVSAQRRTDPRRLGQSIRGELDWIVMKCLEKDRTRRYETAAALAGDVRRHLDDEPISAGPPSVRYRFGKFARRNRTALAAASAVGLALALGMVLSVWQAVRATMAEGLAGQRLTAERRSLFEARLAQARATRRGRQVGQRVESWGTLAGAVRAARDLDLDRQRLLELRNEAIACLALTDLRELQRWEGWPPGSAAGLAFDGDLEYYARSDHQGNLSVRRTRDDFAIAALPGEGATSAAILLFSPGVDRLAVRYFDTLAGQPTNFRLWDWRGRRTILQPPFPVHWGALAFSPDGGTLVLGQENGTLVFYETATGKELRRLSVGFAPSHVAFAPDGRRLAVASAQTGDVHVHDLDPGGEVRKLQATAVARQVAWHRDGALLAAGCEDHEVCIWDTTTGRRAVLQGHQGSVQHVTFSPDGDTLLSDGWDYTCRLWDPWTGRELLRMPGEGRWFSRDGRRLASRTANDLVLWEVVPGREQRTLPRALGSAHDRLAAGDVSPDGRWLAVATQAGVRLWDLAAWKEVGFLPLGRTADVKFDREGKELFTSGDTGLFRWPVQADAGVLRVGPARRLRSGLLGRMSLDGRGRSLAVIGAGVGRVFDLDEPTAKAPGLAHENVEWVAISPDGRRVATGTHHGAGVRVWGAGGTVERELIPDERIAAVAFSPDGRWLAVSTETTIELWEVDQWRCAHRLRREHGSSIAPVFAPDGTLAVMLSHAVVALIDPSSGEPFARLESADADLVSPVSFGPDGSRLVLSTRAGALRVWDLRLVRDRLAELGLDWDRPDYPEPRATDATAVKFESDLGEFARAVEAREQFDRGQKHARSSRWADAVAAYSRVLELQPDAAHAWHERGWARFELGQEEAALADLSKAVGVADAEPQLLNNLAWMLVTCREPRLRDAARALPLAREAVRLVPDRGTFWNTLGVALYRSGDHGGAVEALEKSLELQKGLGCSDYFFLAMAHALLGRTVQARECYRRAVTSMEKNTSDGEELRHFHAEAAELLGVKDGK